MKTFRILVAAVAALLLGTASLHAQTPEQKPFLGTWDLTVTGIPNGDMQVNLTVSFSNDALRGTLHTQDGRDVGFDSIEVDDNVLIAEFDADGFVVNFELSLEEDGTLSGYMMNTFSVTGKKAEKKK
ncbi:MAG: hypothetical protein IJ651_03360 [Bacteroidales bacterium]|nr:hypothetical protein [Bacteroidales bacterium]